MCTYTSVGVGLIIICIFWKLLKSYKNKCSKVYNWNVKIHDTCLDETAYRENKINFYTLQGCWLDLLLTSFHPGTLYWDIIRGNRHTVFKRYTCEVNRIYLTGYTPNFKRNTGYIKCKIEPTYK